MTTEPILKDEVTLMLAVHGGGDAFGPFFATLILTRSDVEQLIRRADLHRAAKNLDPELYQTTYFDYTPNFYESKKSLDADDSTEFLPEYVEKLDAIFEDEDYTTEGVDEIDDEKVPRCTNMRLDYCKLQISSVTNRENVKVDFHWVACIKHTDVEIDTDDLTEEVVQALLGKLA